MAIFGFLAWPDQTRPVSLNGMAARLDYADHVTRASEWHSGPIIASHTEVGSVPVAHAEESDRAAWIDGRILDVSAPAEWLLERTRRDSDLGFLADTEGDFAGVLAEGEHGIVRLFSNRYGTRPLYVGKTPAGIAWSSELKALPGAPGFELRFDADAVTEFLELGVQVGNKTWFRGVNILGAAQIVTLTGPGMEVARYWQWQSGAAAGMSCASLIDRLGELFIESVQRRCARDQAIGVSLSGGLDSRAIVAALPARGRSFHTVSYGRPNSMDRIIARRVARKAGTIHHEIDYTRQTWFEGQREGVWRGDGTSFMHSKGHRLWETRRRWFGDNLHGAGGDGVFGGGHLFTSDAFPKYVRDTYGRQVSDDVLERFRTDFDRFDDAHQFYIEHRIRRFTLGATTLALGAGVNQQFPFLGYALQDLLYDTPVELKKDNVLYQALLMRFFSRFFRRIPWQKTGRALGQPPPHRMVAYYRKRLLTPLRRRRLWPRGPFQDFQDPADWMRRPPARSAIDSVLAKTNPYYAQYVDPCRAKDVWVRHLRGENHSERINRIVSLEWWLEQVIDGASDR